MKLLNLFGLTFMKWCVGGDFNLYEGMLRLLGQTCKDPLYAKDWVDLCFQMSGSKASHKVSKKFSLGSLGWPLIIARLFWMPAL